jgi:uncharacterized protein (DUF486 family)
MTNLNEILSVFLDMKHDATSGIEHKTCVMMSPAFEISAPFILLAEIQIQQTLILDKLFHPFSIVYLKKNLREGSFAFTDY